MPSIDPTHAQSLDSMFGAIAECFRSAADRATKLTADAATMAELCIRGAEVLTEMQKGAVNMADQIGLKERVATEILRGSPRVCVAEFHAAIGAPMHDTPLVPTHDRVRLRLRLIAEEFFELLDAALGDYGDYKPEPWRFDLARAVVFDVVNYSPIAVDLPELADALADLDYVIEGTRLEFGIDGAPIARAVHSANMAKIGGPIDEHGKIGKPPGWTPADIDKALRDQGWTPAVHHVDGGTVACGLPWTTALWPSGERWAGPENAGHVTCRECLARIGRATQ